MKMEKIAKRNHRAHKKAHTSGRFSHCSLTSIPSRAGVPTARLCGQLGSKASISYYRGENGTPDGNRRQRHEIVSVQVVETCGEGAGKELNPPWYLILKAANLSRNVRY